MFYLLCLRFSIFHLQIGNLCLELRFVLWFAALFLLAFLSARTSIVYHWICLHRKVNTVISCNFIETRNWAKHKIWACGSVCCRFKTNHQRHYREICVGKNNERISVDNYIEVSMYSRNEKELVLCCLIH